MYVRTEKNQKISTIVRLTKGSKTLETLIFFVLLLPSDVITLGRHTLLGCGLNLSPKTMPCGKLYTPWECVLIQMLSWGKE